MINGIVNQTQVADSGMIGAELNSAQVALNWDEASCVSYSSIDNVSNANVFYAPSGTNIQGYQNFQGYQRASPPTAHHEMLLADVVERNRTLEERVSTLEQMLMSVGVAALKRRRKLAR